MRLAGGWRERSAAARGYRLLPVAALVAVSVLALRVLPDVVALPEQLAQVPVDASVSLFGAVPVVVSLLLTLPEPAGRVTATSSRGWVTLRVARVVALLAYSLVVVALLAPTPGHAMATTVGLLGEGLAAARVLGDGLAWTLPVAHVVVAAFVGTSQGGVAAPWAWILHQEISNEDVLIAVLTFVVGLVVWSRHEGEDEA